MPENLWVHHGHANGVKVYANSYYGSGMLNLLIKNKGVHEPQEEEISKIS